MLRAPAQTFEFTTHFTKIALIKVLSQSTQLCLSTLKNRATQMSIKLSRSECHEIVVSAKMSRNKSLGLNVHECKSRNKCQRVNVTSKIQVSSYQKHKHNCHEILLANCQIKKQFLFNVTWLQSL